MLGDPRGSSRRSCLVYQWYVPGFHFGWRLCQDFFLFFFPPFLPRGLFTFQDITMGQSSKVLRKAKIRKLTTSLTSSSTCKYKTVYFLTTRPPGRAADRPNINENEPVKRPWLGYLLKEPLKIRQTVPTPDSLENRWQWSIFPALWGGHVFWSRKSTLCLAPCKKWAKKKTFTIHYLSLSPWQINFWIGNGRPGGGGMPMKAHCCAGWRSAIPSLNNGQLYVDLTTGNKEFLTALELLLILAPLLTNSPFLFVLICVGLRWVRLDTEFQLR